jgi:hypothetical protein
MLNLFRRNPQPESHEAAQSAGLGLLTQFSYLQLLDMLTTLAFLTTGVHEANPLVRLAISTTHSPLVGLLGVKVCACAAAIYCSMSGRTRVLARMNFLFAVLVVWNLIALLGK